MVWYPIIHWPHAELAHWFTQSAHAASCSAPTVIVPGPLSLGAADFVVDVSLLLLLLSLPQAAATRPTVRRRAASPARLRFDERKVVSP